MSRRFFSCRDARFTPRRHYMLSLRDGLHATALESSADMIVEACDLEALGRTIEDIADTHGWDNKPILMLVASVSDGGGGLGVLPYPIQPSDIGEDVVLGLQVMAAEMEPGGKLAHYASHPDEATRASFAAAAFVFEAWACPSNGVVRPGGVADQPGAQEVRHVYMADTAGRFVEVARVRGEQPSSRVMEQGDEECRRQLRARVPLALRSIVLAHAANMPDGSYDLDAITLDVLA